MCENVIAHSVGYNNTQSNSDHGSCAQTCQYSRWDEDAWIGEEADREKVNEDQTECRLISLFKAKLCNFLTTSVTKQNWKHKGAFNQISPKLSSVHIGQLNR